MPVASSSSKNLRDIEDVQYLELGLCGHISNQQDEGFPQLVIQLREELREPAIPEGQI